MVSKKDPCYVTAIHTLALSPAENRNEVALFAIRLSEARPIWDFVWSSSPGKLSKSKRAVPISCTFGGMT